MTVLKELCKQFVARAEARELKGKKRDDALIDFMLGAAQALRLTKQEKDFNHVLQVTGLLFTTRGYSECLKIANEP